MGGNDRQRRAARERQRERRRATAGGGPGRGTRDRGHRGLGPDALLRAATAAWGSDDARFEGLVRALSARPGASLPVLARALDRALDDLWGCGWAPVDLVQVTGRQLSSDHADLVAALTVADGRRRVGGGQRLHPRWEAQLAGLEERRAVDDDVVLGEGTLRSGVEVLCLAARLPSVPSTIPAPGTVTGPWDRSRGLDERVLARVRALLAKAESTTFDEEAEALTAKAQELIARHAVDEALLHDVDDVGEPSMRRIPVDPPYAGSKAVLLTEVAEANRCRIVYSDGCGWVTVFGYDGDLQAVELLAASLLAQASAAMARHGSRRDAAGRSRTRSFRRSFLLGFACRIGERLRETSQAQVAATDAARLLPVLAARDDRIDEAVVRAFPRLERRSSSIGHGGGFAAGQAAADLADLHVAAGALDGVDT